MDISLIIPAYNEETYIGGAIESVHRHASGKFKEIVVVDNASTDRTAEVASKYPGVRVVCEAQKGLTSARQAGFQATTGEFLAFMDADCRMTPQWFSAVERHYAKHPEAICLTGPIRYYDGPLYMRLIIGPLQWVTLPPAYFIVGFLVIGGNFVARRSALERAGGFDRAISFYGEDANIARRLSKLGPVLLRMDVILETSARRLTGDGIAITFVRYTLNFFWQKLFGRSFTRSYTDVRR